MDGFAGTGNIGGFKSGCTSNLVPANGVLNAPDYTRTCTCSYQNQTSLALVHAPEVEAWTFSSLPTPKRRIRRVGINLGAPGDCLAADGTLWLDYPSVGGPSPDVPVAMDDGQVKWFRRHSSRITSGTHPWVVASGCEGLRRLAVTLAPAGAKDTVRYTVRLYFAVGDDGFGDWAAQEAMQFACPVGPQSGIGAIEGGRGQGASQPPPQRGRGQLIGQRAVAGGSAGEHFCDVGPRFHQAEPPAPKPCILSGFTDQIGENAIGLCRFAPALEQHGIAALETK